VLHDAVLCSQSESRLQAAAAVLKLINLWPSDEIAKSVVTAYLFPLVLGASSKAIASGAIRPPAPA